MKAVIRKSRKILILFVLIGSIISCGGENTDNFTPFVNQFEYLGGINGLFQSAIVDFENPSIDTANYGLIIASIDIEIIGFGESGGVGSVFYFDLYSHSTTELGLGTYTISNAQSPGTITEVYAQIDYDSSVPSEEKIVGFKSGQIAISKENEDYVLVFTLTTEEDEVLNGTFKGALATITN